MTDIAEANHSKSATPAGEASGPDWGNWPGVWRPRDPSGKPPRTTETGGREERPRAPPDDRTPQEVEDDEQAERQHWQNCLDEGYEAASEHSTAADDRSWPSRLKRAAGKLFR